MPSVIVQLQPDVDLSSCATEPIHIPGRIQPHGVLLVLDDDLRIAQVSTNTYMLLNVAAEDLLGASLKQVFDPERVDELRARLPFAHLAPINPFLLTQTDASGQRSFSGVLHPSQGKFILELELVDSAPVVFSATFFHMMNDALARLRTAQSLNDLCQIAAEELRRITGYDRVMIYRFDQHWNGEVIAEDRAAVLEPFLGLHYPASDIPAQARALYLRNWLRIIGDVTYQPAGILAYRTEDTAQPLDLSHAVLRSVSPLHIEYLQNMGVAATLTISLVQDDRLWGMIACHHYAEPKFMPHELRNVCEMLGQVLSGQVGVRAANENYAYAAHLKALQAELAPLTTLSDADFLTALRAHEQHLCDLVDATGVVVALDGALLRVGATPNDADLRVLLSWLAQTMSSDLFATDALARAHPPAAAYQDVASGLLAVLLAQPGDYILWFRPEIIRTVTWGGDPNKAVSVEDPGARLMPRKSFAAWKETIRQTARPWLTVEIDATTDFRRRREVIARQRAEQSLLTSEAQYRTLADAIDDVVTLHELDGRLIYVSPAITRHFGLLPSELLRQAHWSHIHPDDRRALVHAARGVQASGEAAEIECRFQDKTGAFIWQATRMVLIRDGAGHPHRLLCSSRDISERKRAEDNRLAIERKLMEVQKLESMVVLAGGVAHDFNNLIQAILGNAHLALTDLVPGSEVHTSLLEVESAAQRAAELTQQLLAYAGRGRFTIQMVDLSLIVVEMGHLLRSSIPRAIQIDYHMTPGLPAVLADATQLRQMLMNLVINAAEAIGTDMGTITITTKLITTAIVPPGTAYMMEQITEGTYIALSVADTGSGMDEATRAHIFEPFFTTKFTGRGLGLASVMGIVRGHRGALWLESTPGGGSTFTLLLPTSVAASAAAPLAAPAPEVARGRGTILVVDDEQSVRIMISRALERRGFQVLVAPDGVAGLELFRAHAPDIVCVLVDMLMPRMNGKQTIEALVQIRPGVPIILMSGYNEQQTIEQLMANYVVRFLQKPFRLHVLDEVLEQMLTSASL